MHSVATLMVASYLRITFLGLITFRRQICDTLKR